MGEQKKKKTVLPNVYICTCLVIWNNANNTHVYKKPRGILLKYSPHFKYFSHFVGVCNVNYATIFQWEQMTNSHIVRTKTYSVFVSERAARRKKKKERGNFAVWYVKPIGFFLCMWLWLMVPVALHFYTTFIFI